MKGMDFLMDKNMDMNNFGYPPYMNYDMGYDPMMGDGAMFNPVVQYGAGIYVL